MRRVLGVLVLVATAACGGHGATGPRTPAFAKGAKVKITDGGQIYDALNTTDCVRWPSAAVKKRAGQSGWESFHPDEGLEGIVLVALPHCDHKTQVVLVSVGEYVVPVTSTGVTGTAAPATVASEKPVAVLDTAPTPTGEETLEGEWVEGGVVGGVISAGSGYAPGDMLMILDAGGIYDTINQTDCVKWPTETMKKKAGSDAWGGYTPQDGETGPVVAVMQHCDGYTEIVVLEIGGHLVPIGSSSVAPYSP
jgi:hypothetical protein